MTFEQHLGRRNHLCESLKKNVSCGRNSKCTGSVAEMIVVCSRKRKKVVMAPRNLVVGERMEGHEVVEIGAKSCSIFEDMFKS